MSKSLSARPALPDVALLAASQVIALEFVAPGGHVRSELAAIVMSPLSFWLKRLVNVAAEAGAGGGVQGRAAGRAGRGGRGEGKAAVAGRSVQARTASRTRRRERARGMSAWSAGPAQS